MSPILSRHILAVGLLSLAAGSPLASAQVQPEAKAKLQAMADAIKGAQSFSFSSTLTGTGVMSVMPVMKGEVIMAKGDKPGNPKMRVEGSRGEGMGSPEMTFILVADGTYRTWIDHPSKQVIQRTYATATQGEPNSVTDLIIPREFVASDPFAAHLAAPKIELEKEPATSDGVACDVIDVDLGENQNKFRWCIGQADHLPRKLVQDFAGGGMSQIWALKGAKLNAPTDDKTWKIVVPEGYTFAAAPTPPPPPAAPPAGGPGGAPGLGKPGGPLSPGGPKTRTIGVNADDLAPDFELAASDGAKFKLSDQRGSVVLLDFWGSWCPPCRTASPEIQKLADKYKALPVKVVGLSAREKTDDAASNYMKEHKLTFALLPKADDVAKQYRVRNFPSFYVIGKEGEIVFAFTGMYDDQTPKQLADALDAALAGKAMGGASPGGPMSPLGPGAPGGKPAGPGTMTPKGGGSAKDQKH